MRILIYGAGVIGSLYGALLSEAGYDITLYARGKRLESLRNNGLLYKRKGQIRKAKVDVLSFLEKTDCYDFILLSVREHQLLPALEELKRNDSPTIVTMVNSIDVCELWETVCGKGRILPAFPGAGGGFDADVLDADLTPRLIQPTTIGKKDGREKVLAGVFRSAGIPVQIVPDMHVWQICHLAMVVPIADAYYEAADPERAGNDTALMKKTARRIRENMQVLSRHGIKLSPAKMYAFLFLPSALSAAVLGAVFRSSFGNRFMYQHSMKAPDEMYRLHDRFYNFLQSRC